MVIDMKNIQLRKQYNQTIEKLQKGSHEAQFRFLAQNRYFYDWKLEDIVFLHGQNPLSTAVKTFEEWQALGISVKSGQNASYLMLDRSDLLSKRVSYFDITQTTQDKMEKVNFSLPDFYRVTKQLMQADYSHYLEFGLGEFLYDFSLPVLDKYDRLNAGEKQLVPLIATYTLSEKLGIEISSDTLSEIEKYLDPENNLMNVVKVANNLCVRVEQELTTGLARIQAQSQKNEEEKKQFEAQFLEELATTLSLSESDEAIGNSFEIVYNQAKDSIEIDYLGNQLLLTDMLEHPDFVTKYEEYWAIPLENLVDLEQLENELRQQEIVLETEEDFFSLVEQPEPPFDYDLILEQLSDESQIRLLSPVNEEENTYYQAVEFLLHDRMLALELKVYSPNGEVAELTENAQNPYIVEVWEEGDRELILLGILAYGEDYARDFSAFAQQLSVLEETAELEQVLIENGEALYQNLIEGIKQEQLEISQTPIFEEMSQTAIELLQAEKTRVETLLAEKGLLDFSIEIEGEETLTLTKSSFGGILHTVQGEYHVTRQQWELGIVADEQLKALLFPTEQEAEIQSQPVIEVLASQPELSAPIFDEVKLDDLYNKEIQRGTGTQNGKFPMQALFEEFPNMTKKEAQMVIKTFYHPNSYYGHSGYGDEGLVTHSPKGIEFYDLDKVLSWQKVSEQVRKLVIENDYLISEKETAEYHAWLAAEDTQYRDWHDYQELREKIQATYQVQAPIIEPISLFDDLPENDVKIVKNRPNEVFEKKQPEISVVSSYRFNPNVFVVYRKDTALALEGRFLVENGEYTNLTFSIGTWHEQTNRLDDYKLGLVRGLESEVLEKIKPWEKKRVLELAKQWITLQPTGRVYNSSNLLYSTQDISWLPQFEQFRDEFLSSVPTAEIGQETEKETLGIQENYNFELDFLTNDEPILRDEFLSFLDFSATEVKLRIDETQQRVTVYHEEFGGILNTKIGEFVLVDGQFIQNQAIGDTENVQMAHYQPLLAQALVKMNNARFEREQEKVVEEPQKDWSTKEFTENVLLPKLQDNERLANSAKINDFQDWVLTLREEVSDVLTNLYLEKKYQSSAAFLLNNFEMKAQALERIQEQLYADLENKEMAEPILQDFSFPEDTSHFYPKTKDDKIQANLEAVRLVKQLELENKQATPDQQEILAQYVGWGGLVDVFDERLEKYETERLALQELVTKEEYRAMEMSVLTAYYTEPHVIRTMFEKIEDMGFEGGRILEPAIGTGNFLSAMPTNLRDKSQVVGVELDTITGKIAQHLHPSADIRIQGFETTNFYQGAFDLVVGNVPFSDLKIQGERDKKGYMIHDYFIQKSLALTRENGIVALITSNGTMDKKNQSFRKELANQAVFLGAVRLPNTAFSKLAGTKVTSDILFFQKTELDNERYIREEYRPETEEMVRLENYPDWVTSGGTTFSPEIALNNYFEENPEQILGNVKIQNYHGKTLTVVPNDIPLEESLPKQLKEIQGIYQTGELELLEENLQEREKQVLPISEADISPFTYEIFAGKAYYREASGIEEVALKGQQLPRLSSLIALRKAVQAVFGTQTDINGFSESKYESARVALNNVYDRFVRNYDFVHALLNQTLFRKDDHFQLLNALEIPQEEIVNDEVVLTYHKAEIFDRPTIRKMNQLVTAQNALEALQLSLNHRGGVSFEFMAHIYPYTQEQIIEELKGEIYFDSTRDEWQTKAEYLSGNVRVKLEEAEQSLLDYPNDGYEANVQALKEVQPEWLPLEMIDYRLGSSWIAWETYQEFVADVLDLKFSKTDMKRDKNDKWVLKGKGRYSEKSKIYNTKRVEVAYLLEKSLNQQFITVRDKVINSDGKERWIFNAKETILAQEKQTLLQEAFKRYIENHPEHRKTLETRYNLSQNCIVLRQYDGSHLTFDSLNQNIELRPHQKDAVARIVSEQRGLLAHVVGSGKTLTMIAAGMKLKELGKIQKPMYVVPNHLVGEFGSEILRAYPDKNVLTTTAKDFEKNNRKAFISRIATGTYDAIVIGMSQFERVPMSLEAQKAHLENQLSDVMAQIREGKAEDDKGFTVKQALQTKARLEIKLKKLIEGHSKRDTFIDFEELGVDFLFVDESHNYKNLFFQTKHTNVAGINSSASNRATDMYLKVRHIQEHHNGNHVVFATGTPISNSMAEMYTLMHYLEPDVLDQAGIHHFDKWASTFGVIEESVELNVESSNYRKRTRFGKFTNVPELMRLFSSVADVQTQDMLNLPVPEHTTHIVACPTTEAQRIYMETLVKRAEAIRNGADPTLDNMLVLCNDASKIALDPRLINPSLFDSDDSSKLPRCIEKVYQLWQETSDERSTQIIFSDLGTPQAKGTHFNVYQAIKDDLIEKGVPSDEIRFIHEADNDKKKERLFQDVRVGNVRILLGSTQKLGTGTNIQNKLLAVHHLDVPWRPSDLEQRNGRVIRQGNENKQVHIYNYVTEGTFDAYRWQVVENKLKYITQVMTSKSPARSMEDVDEAVIDASEVKAIATGNPLLKERAMLENDVNRLKLLSQNYGSEQKEWQRKVENLPTTITSIQEAVAICETDQMLLKQNFSKDNFSITINGRSFDNREEAGVALLKEGRRFAKSSERAEYETIGEIAGLEIQFCQIARQMAPKVRLTSDRQLYRDFELNFDSPTGSVTRFVNEVENIQEGKYIKEAEQKLLDTHTQLAVAKENFGKPFERAEELQEKSHQLSRLMKAITLNIDLEELETIEKGLEEDKYEDRQHEKQEEMGQVIS
ncbi:SNF2-related protein [Listeria innocua]|uniref:SNF2-related protein n=1 Tax=Listeria innocua TaxID=1642 RepID=UPI001629C88C|nr:SNF2-related protein [Listeria innocua]MBC1925552.1 DEAD/DEAH box helicase family protein [Listeria innocua]